MGAQVNESGGIAHQQSLVVIRKSLYSENNILRGVSQILSFTYKKYRHAAQLICSPRSKLFHVSSPLKRLLSRCYIPHHCTKRGTSGSGQHQTPCQIRASRRSLRPAPVFYAASNTGRAKPLVPRRGLPHVRLIFAQRQTRHFDGPISHDNAP